MCEFDSSTRARLRTIHLRNLIRYSINEEFKDYVHRLASPAGNFENFHPFRVMEERLRLNIPDTIDQRVIPLFDTRYKGSILLKQLSLLLTKVLDRAQRPAFTTHIDVPSNALKGERCNICLEDLEDNIANKDWKDSHSPVITSCGHIFGGNCLSRWLSDTKTRSCPYCRKDFNQISEASDLKWQTWGDMWRWYVERKHTLPCGEEEEFCQVSGRYLWDNCSLGEVQAQFYAQDTTPILPQHWLNILLDINMNLRAGDHLNTRNLRKYVKRTRIVLEGLCCHIPRKDAQAIKRRLLRLLPIGILDKKKVGDWTAEKRHEICAGLLNILHGAVNLFEKHTKLRRWEKFKEQMGEVSMISLDYIQANCGMHGDDYSFPGNQIIWEIILWADKETENGVAPDDMCFNLLRREQDGVLEAVSKFLWRTSNPLEVCFMRSYLIERIGILWSFCRMFSEEQCRMMGQSWPELIEGERNIIKALEKLRSQQRREREKAGFRKREEDKYW